MKGESRAPAQVVVLRAGRGDLGGDLAQLRLIQFDDAAQAVVIARLREPQGLLSLRDKPRRHIQAAKRGVGFEPRHPHLLGNLHRQILDIFVDGLARRLGFALARRVQFAVKIGR